MCTNHRVADAASFGTFLKAWAHTASGNLDAVIVLDFGIASIFPARDDFQTLPPHIYQLPPPQISAAKLNALKVKATIATVPQPNRVQAVSALIWKYVVVASRSRSPTRPRPSALVLSANKRACLVPPLPEWCFGNVGHPLVANLDDEIEMDLARLVGRIGEGKLELGKNCAATRPEICSSIMELGKEQVGMMGMRGSEEVDVYAHTSWCRMPWYEADFGWGKPTWATIGSVGVPNVSVLSEARDEEGIEVWVCLIEQDMALFQSTQDLLAFATLNPSALN
ncbi:unnamed protein product [Camellia sinensis]